MNIMHPLATYARTGQAASDATRALNELLARKNRETTLATSLRDEIAARQKRLDELPFRLRIARNNADNAESLRLQQQGAQDQQALPQLRTRLATSEAALAQMDTEEARLRAAIAAPSTPTPTVSCAELQNRIQSATAMGQAPPIIAALNSLYARQNCNVSCEELDSRIQNAIAMGQAPAIVNALRSLRANKPCPERIETSTTPATPAARNLLPIAAGVVALTAIVGGAYLWSQRKAATARQ